MIYAKPSTSLLVVFRAYLASDHVTPATGKTIAITISKNGGAFGNPNAGATNATEISSGFYKVTLDTTDTGTSGPLAVRGAVATVDDVGVLFYVGQSPADVTHFGGTAATTSGGRPEVNTTHLAGTAYASADLSTTMKASINTEADTALSDYGPLKPTTAGRTLDVSAGGEAGVDWANVGSPTTTLALTGTTIATTQKVDIETIKTVAVTAEGAGVSIPTLIASRTNITGGTITTTTNLTTNNDKTGYSLTATTGLGNQTADITGNLSGSVGSVTGSVGSVTGAVGSVTGAVGSVTGAVGSVTGNVGGNVTGSVGSLATQAKADVNAEVLDVLNTDTFAEPGQEAPASTNTLAKKIGYLFKFLRNKITQTSTTLSVFADDATTVDQKATISDDGTTYTRGEIGTGP